MVKVVLKEDYDKVVSALAEIKSMSEEGRSFTNEVILHVYLDRITETAYNALKEN